MSSLIMATYFKYFREAEEKRKEGGRVEVEGGWGGKIEDRRKEQSWEPL